MDSLVVEAFVAEDLTLLGSKCGLGWVRRGAPNSLLHCIYYSFWRIKYVALLIVKVEGFAICTLELCRSSGVLRAPSTEVAAQTAEHVRSWVVNFIVG